MKIHIPPAGWGRRIAQCREFSDVIGAAAMPVHVVASRRLRRNYSVAGKHPSGMLNPFHAVCGEINALSFRGCCRKNIQVKL
jgi:hypothetical protein